MISEHALRKKPCLRASAIKPFTQIPAQGVVEVSLGDRSFYRAPLQERIGDKLISGWYISVSGAKKRQGVGCAQACSTHVAIFARRGPRCGLAKRQWAHSKDPHSPCPTVVNVPVPTRNQSRRKIIKGVHSRHCGALLRSPQTLAGTMLVRPTLN